MPRTSVVAWSICMCCASTNPVLVVQPCTGSVQPIGRACVLALCVHGTSAAHLHPLAVLAVFAVREHAARGRGRRAAAGDLPQGCAGADLCALPPPLLAVVHTPAGCSHSPKAVHTFSQAGVACFLHQHEPHSSPRSLYQPEALMQTAHHSCACRTQRQRTPSGAAVVWVACVHIRVREATALRLPQ